MHQYTMSLDGESVGIQSAADLGSIFAQWKEFANLTGIEVRGDEDCEFVIEYVDDPGNQVNYSAKHVRVAVAFDELGTGELLLYAALPFLEVLHQRKAVVTMHAAAVELRGEAILLLGKAGAGKTSATLSLCRNHQARLIGNDIVKVGLFGGKILACTGSKYFFLRQESIKRNIPDLLSLFPRSEKDPWTHKIYCLPNALGINTGNDFVPITRSYLVHVDETMEEIYAKSADSMDTRLYLSENMSRYIRGTAIALFSKQSRFMGYVPSYDTPDFFDMRVGLAEALISTTKIMYVAGNLHDTCHRIISEMET